MGRIAKLLSTANRARLATLLLALWQARLAEAQASADKLPRIFWGAVIVLAVWLLVLGGVAYGVSSVVFAGSAA